MSFFSATRLALSLVWVAACCVGSLAADEGIDSDQVVKDFLSHIQALEIDASLKQQTQAKVQEMWGDEYTRPETVTAGLVEIYPDYAAALGATEDDEAANAVERLTPFIESSDKFLAADASFFLARSLINQQRYEAALPILEGLTENLSKFSQQAGPATYFTGLAQASLLENQRAIKSFTAFLNNYETAPERLRVAAWRQIQTIQAIEEGAMTDVLQRMDYSRRRLEINNTDESTQTQQEKIVSMLGQLIKQQEKKECSNCNSKKNGQKQQNQNQQAQKGKQGKGKGKSNAGGTSSNPNGVVRRTYDDGPASPWSQLRDRSRDPANNAVKERLPARYKRVVEKYYGKTSGNDTDK